jgi:hypothetical protein
MLAEFQFVSGLIPFYRRVELTVLAGTGLVISGVVAALAALEAAENPNAAAEGILLAVGASAPTFLLLVENMALTRLRRASLYIAKDLHPLALRLTGREEVLRWECGPARRLMESIEESGTEGSGREGGLASLIVRRKPVQMFASSIPLLGTIAGTSLVLAIAGVFVDFTILNLALGGLAGAFSLALAAYGIAFTWLQEQRVGED